MNHCVTCGHWEHRHQVFGRCDKLSNGTDDLKHEAWADNGHGEPCDVFTLPTFGCTLHKPAGVLAEALAILRADKPPPLSRWLEVDKGLRDILLDVDSFWVRWSARLEEVKDAYLEKAARS